MFLLDINNVFVPEEDALFLIVHIFNPGVGKPLIL